MGSVNAHPGDIVRRQLSFLGHVLRKDELEKLVVTGFVNGKRARGRQRETFLTYLGKMTQKLPMELLQMAKNRTVWSKKLHLHTMFKGTDYNFWLNLEI